MMIIIIKLIKFCGLWIFRKSKIKLSINSTLYISYYIQPVDKVNVGNRNPSRDYIFTHREMDLYNKYIYPNVYVSSQIERATVYMYIINMSMREWNIVKDTKV